MTLSWFTKDRNEIMRRREIQREKGGKKFIIVSGSFFSAFMILYIWYELYQLSIEYSTNFGEYIQLLRTNNNPYFMILGVVYIVISGYLWAYLTRIGIKYLNEKNYKKRKEEQNKKTDIQNTSI